MPGPVVDHGASMAALAGARGGTTTGDGPALGTDGVRDASRTTGEGTAGEGTAGEGFRAVATSGLGTGNTDPRG
jgi:hypothetical protein